MPRQVVEHGIYRHFKGKFYIVEGIAKHSETGEPMVVYRHLYGDRSLCVRPMDMFLSEVDREKYPDAEQQHRFELVDEYGVIAKPPEEENELEKTIKDTTYISLTDWLVLYFYMLDNRLCKDGEFVDTLNELSGFREAFMRIGWCRFNKNIVLSYGPEHLARLSKQVFEVDTDTGYVTCNLEREQMQHFINKLPGIVFEITNDAFHHVEQMRIIRGTTK